MIKKILMTLITILILTSCTHFEKKAPCEFDKHKTKNKSIKEDLTR